MPLTAVGINLVAVQSFDGSQFTLQTDANAAQRPARLRRAEQYAATRRRALSRLRSGVPGRDDAKADHLRWRGRNAGAGARRPKPVDCALGADW